MLSIDEARAAIIDSVAAVARRSRRPLADSYNRILAEPIQARSPAPPHANSAMDGYALRVEYCLKKGARFKLRGTIAAGDAAGELTSGTAARILTGAPLPRGANTVVIQENVALEGDEIELRCDLQAGQNVRLAGEDIEQGQTIANAGDALTPMLAAMLAASGIDTVSVYEPITVTLFNTGNELHLPGQPLPPGGIYNANRFLLEGLLHACHCQLPRIETLPDDCDKTVAALQAASDSDLIITTGGVSVGDQDHVKAALAQCGNVSLWKVRMKPGKPLAFGFVSGPNKATPLLGLPGNPVSAFIAFVIFALPLIEKCQGRRARALEPLLMKAGFNLEIPASRPEYLRVRLHQDTLVPYPKQGSAILSSLHWADGLALVPANRPVRAGDRLEYYPLTQFFGAMR